MPYLLAWGNNLTGNLDPTSDDAIISTPRHVLKDFGVEEIVWSSWTSTIGRVGDVFYIWGSHIPGGPGRPPTKLSLPSGPVKFLGADEATAYLGEDGFVRTLSDNGSKSSKSWQDIGTNSLELVHALSTEMESPAKVYSFKSFGDFMLNSEPTPVIHPLLASIYSLHSADTRVFGLTTGPLMHLLEIDSKGSVNLVEDLEGLGIESVNPGTANRLAVITEAGDAYLIHNRTLVPELLELEDESAVRFVGVGSKHEVVVTEENVWVRGENQFRQLGMDGEAQEEFVTLPYFDEAMIKRIKSVHSGRWSTIFVMHDS